MGCGCNKGVGTSGNGDTIGYYLVLPDGTVLPTGVNPENPDAGAPPYMFYNEARAQVVLNNGGTVKRLRRKPVTA